MGKSKLSIFTITYNEAEHLEFWYKQHKDLADEIIVVDTDSIDGTQEIAKKLPIKFIETKWHHSFAEAKNLAIRHCSGDWLLSLAPDYWINKRNFKMIRKAIEANDKKAFWMPLVHHFTDWNGGNEEKPSLKNFEKEDYLANCHLALFKNDPFIRYQGRVHENVHESVWEKYGKDSCGFIPATRHHDNTKNQISNPLKLKYYWFLENLSALERKAWEVGQELRKKAYDAER
jgi:glycosyltransferase involved in cell wall biosynthesis